MSSISKIIGLLIKYRSACVKCKVPDCNAANPSTVAYDLSQQAFTTFILLGALHPSWRGMRYLSWGTWDDERLRGVLEREEGRFGLVRKIL